MFLQPVEVTCYIVQEQSLEERATHTPLTGMMVSHKIYAAKTSKCDSAYCRWVKICTADRGHKYWRQLSTIILRQKGPEKCPPNDHQHTHTWETWTKTWPSIKPEESCNCQSSIKKCELGKKLFKKNMENIEKTRGETW